METGDHTLVYATVEAVLPCATCVPLAWACVWPGGCHLTCPAPCAVPCTTAGAGRHCGEQRALPQVGPELLIRLLNVLAPVPVLGLPSSSRRQPGRLCRPLLLRIAILCVREDMLPSLLNLKCKLVYLQSILSLCIGLGRGSDVARPG